MRNLTFLPLFITIAAYQIGLFLSKKVKSPLCNPLLIAIVLVISTLLLTGYPNETYQAGMTGISWLLTPATICLAVPLYEQLQVLKKDLWAILISICAGTVTSLLFVFGFCRIAGLGDTLTASLLPKSVTTAVGLALSEQAGGNGAIATAAIIITGILGSIIGPTLCKLLRIKHPIAQGVAFGTASHVIGTSKAHELSELTGAVSSLSLTIAALITTLLLSFLSQFV